MNRIVLHQTKVNNRLKTIKHVNSYYNMSIKNSTINYKSTETPLKGGLGSRSPQVSKPSM